MPPAQPGLLAHGAVAGRTGTNARHWSRVVFQPGLMALRPLPKASFSTSVTRNHIYYSKEEHSSLHDDPESLARLDLGSCAVYSYDSERVHHLEGIMSRGYHYLENDDIITWIFPPHS